MQSKQIKQFSKYRNNPIVYLIFGNFNTTAVISVSIGAITTKQFNYAVAILLFFFLHSLFSGSQSTQNGFKTH